MVQWNITSDFEQKLTQFR